MKKIISLIIITIFCLSCNRVQKKKVNYDEQGNFVSSYLIDKKDTIAVVEFIEENLSFAMEEGFVKYGDTIYENYKTGIVFLKIVPLDRYNVYFERYSQDRKKILEGYIKNNKKDSVWSYYTNDKLEKQYFYMTVNDSAYLSEIIVYDKNGIINEEESNYINWQLPDTLMTGKSIGNVEYKNIKEDIVQTFVCIGYEINSNFDNLPNVRIDTFPYPNKNNDFEGFIGLEFSKQGKQIIRGFIYENYIEEESECYSTIDISQRYFEKEFYVIPRPDSIPKNKVIRYDNY